MTQLKDITDALLLDLDGTVWESGRAIAGAVEAIVASGVDALYVTNNASRAPADVAQMLQAIGLDADSRQVVTSAQVAAELAAQVSGSGARALVLGSPSFKQLAEDAGLVVVSGMEDPQGPPEVVLHGHNPETGWAQLSEAALALRAGARYIASNLDSSLPSDRGLMVGNGSMVAAVVSATGISPTSAGKPEPAMFEAAARSVGAQRPLAVGDRLDTDIRGGNNAQMPTLHVMTGVSRQWDLIAAPPQDRPTYLAADLGGLFDAPDSLRPQSQGDFVAQVAPAGARVELRGGTGASTSMQALRTVLGTVWAQDREAEWTVAACSDAAERCIAEWS